MKFWYVSIKYLTISLVLISVKNKIKTISILGAGSWGGTIAWLLSKKKLNIKLWTPIKKEYEFIKKNKLLPKPKKIKLSKNILITNNLKEVISNSDLVIIVVPTNAFKDTVIKLKKSKIRENMILLSATKGITIKENLRPTVILKKYLPKNPIAVLSGPNIALDILTEAPIISTIAAKNKKLGSKLQEIISSKNFRVYFNSDIIGVEIAGALKNVIAVAAGMSDGFGFSISTKAALISRGLVEIVRIAIKEGAKPITLLGASGIGDLIATCFSKDSRNYRVGFALGHGKGKKLDKILKDLGQVAEGVETVKAMINLAKKHKIDTPIAKSVYDIVVKKQNPKIVLKKLLNRPLPKSELDY